MVIIFTAEMAKRFDARPVDDQVYQGEWFDECEASEDKWERLF